MVEQLTRPKDKAEIYWFSEQPYGHVGDQDLEQYDSGRLGFPNTFCITSTMSSTHWQTRSASMASCPTSITRHIGA